MAGLPPTVAQLEARLGVPAGSLADEDLARASAALDDATVLVLAEVESAKAQHWHVDAPDVTILVALKAARREFENPRGISQETLIDHTVGMTDTSGVYLTEREIAQVQRASTKRKRPFVGSIATPTALDNTPDYWAYPWRR